uniref:Tropomodulin n=1 Tax=Halisarca dujardinii TaxID=2583056 RepID=A0A9F1UCU0_HALDU|nr:tropomodulin [Halisarca dujardinii]
MSKAVREDACDDSLFEGLSKEEIEELDGFLDPDNELLPASDRLPPQTNKRTTAPYQREHLVEYMQTKALSTQDKPEPVPFIKKTRGRVFKPQEDRHKVEEKFLLPSFTGKGELEQDKAKLEKKAVLSKELEELFDGVEEADLAELAGELGLEETEMTGFLASKNTLTASSHDNDDTRGGPSPLRRVPSPQVYTYHSSNPLVQPHVEEPTPAVDLPSLLRRLGENDPAVREVNLNNQEDLRREGMQPLVEALKGNTKLKCLQMANTRFTDTDAQLLMEALKVNIGLRKLNLESNRITAKGMKLLLRALEDNPMLEELKLANQQSCLGAGVEMDIAKIIERNTTLKKFGLSFTSNGPRVLVDKYIMRNTDIARKKRLLAEGSNHSDEEEEEVEEDEEDYDDGENLQV